MIKSRYHKWNIEESHCNKIKLLFVISGRLKGFYFCLSNDSKVVF